MKQKSDQNITKSSFNFWPWFAVALLSVVAAVNAFMIYSAQRTNLPLVEESPYEKGQDYQKIIDQKSAFLNTGWAISLSAEPIENSQQKMIIRIHDSNSGQNIENLSVQLRALRPNKTGKDQIITFKQEGDLYSAKTSPLAQGLWLFTYIIQDTRKTYIYKTNYMQTTP